MFPIVGLKGSTVSVKTWTPVHEIESQALDQLRNVASLPIVAHHVAVMPDVHYGKGATVGSVIATKGGISPAAVGVDIGCGMRACQTNLKASDLPESLKSLRNQIERDIPCGREQHKGTDHVRKQGQHLEDEASRLMLQFGDLDWHVHSKLHRAANQIGSLGGGNHFIEICLDEHDNVWLMLHSGSRNIGKELAEIHISKARELRHNTKLPDPDLAYFLSNTDEMEAYRRDLLWAQCYAKLNRRVMFSLLQSAVLRHIPHAKFDAAIDCHHNYVSEEHHFGDDLFITRKGAIYAGVGAMGIIPGSMGTKSYIVCGKGHPESFNSASHGAGRRMSRSKARKEFTLEDLAKQTEGVECRKDGGVIDESPGAYKPIEQVMANQENLVSIVATLKQVLCVKG